MYQKLIIDGYNMLHQIDAYRDLLNQELALARDKLIHDLKIYQSIRKIEIIVIFDGAPDVYILPEFTTPSNIEVIFSRAPCKADPLIMRKIGSEPQKGRLLIITDDREITSFAKTAGCRCLSPKVFYQRMNTASTEIELDRKFNHEMSEAELKEWKKIFGIDEKK